jgi:hypothetical protein
MPLTTIPGVDLNVCSGWTEQQLDLYNHLDFYLAKLSVERRKTYATHSRLFGSIAWKPNMGPIMKGVRKEPSPHLRQFAFPQRIRNQAKKDVHDVREVTVPTEVYHHKFESPIMNFLPDFRDFMTDHVDAHGIDLEDKKQRYLDIFCRGFAFHAAPFIWVAGRSDANPLTEAPSSDDQEAIAAGTKGKTQAFLADMAGKVGNPGNLSLTEINAVVTSAEEDLRIVPFTGAGDSAPKDNATPNLMYCLVLSAEAWNQFIYDPWLLANKNCDLNVITNGFRGNLFGRVTCKLEDLPLRMKVDCSFPAPESRVLAPDAYNVGETIISPEFSLISNCPLEWAFLYGGEGFKALKIGPPPAAFANNGLPEGFGKMRWNGEVIITKNLIMKCMTDDNNVEYEPNSYGEYLKFISHITLGAIAQQRRNVIPILFKRRRGPGPQP